MFVPHTTSIHCSVAHQSKYRKGPSPCGFGQVKIWDETRQPKRHHSGTSEAKGILPSARSALTLPAKSSCCGSYIAVSSLEEAVRDDGQSARCDASLPMACACRAYSGAVQGTLDDMFDDSRLT